ncbi:hypothetical protein ADUPG1_003294, partial [Aduncisulcus paluster]
SISSAKVKPSTYSKSSKPSKVFLGIIVSSSKSFTLTKVTVLSLFPSAINCRKECWSTGPINPIGVKACAVPFTFIFPKLSPQSCIYHLLNPSNDEE